MNECAWLLWRYDQPLLKIMLSDISEPDTYAHQFKLFLHENVYTLY